MSTAPDLEADRPIEKSVCGGPVITQFIGGMPADAAAVKAGDSVRMPIMEGAGHFDGINPQAPAWETVMAASDRS